MAIVAIQLHRTIRPKQFCFQMCCVIELDGARINRTRAQRSKFRMRGAEALDAAEHAGTGQATLTGGLTVLAGILTVTQLTPRGLPLAPGPSGGPGPASAGDARGQPRARLPHLVGPRLPSPYHFPARIQSFQAVAAPFRGGFVLPSASRAAIPATETPPFKRSTIGSAVSSDRRRRNKYRTTTQLRQDIC